MADALLYPFWGSLLPSTPPGRASTIAALWVCTWASTPMTISMISGKLGIRSRAELGARLASEEGEPP
jgi:hypothetical protein